MYKRLITFLIVFWLLICISSAQARLIHHWKFEENTADGATVAVDSVGGLNGDIQGAQSVPGKAGNALSFDGADDVVSIDNFIPPQEGTIVFWINPALAKNKERILGAGGDYEVWLRGNGELKNELFDNGSSTTGTGAGALKVNEWNHIAATYDSTITTVEIYLDGELWIAGTAEVPSTPTQTTLLLGHREGASDGEHYGGFLDDIRIYDHVLSQAEIKALANPPRVSARDPIPVDGDLIEDTWVNLEWTPGDFAVSHDIYIGDNFDDVINSTEGTFVGNQTDTFIVVGFPGFPYPDGLVPSMTYYWRIDEVNVTEPNSPWKGDVWSFSVPPKTAYFPDPADGAESIDVDVQLSWTSGFGSKLHTVYIGDNLEEINNATSGQTQGSATYTPGTLKMAKTYYWRVDEFDIVETHKGDVWSFTTEGAVGSPSPGKGAVDVMQTPVLTWAPGFGATHEIYFGPDPSSLELKASGKLGEESYEPGQLEWNTTYYWRIDEANNVNTDSPWTGPLWSFTTANFLIIDDMESYNDIDETDPASNRIYLAWIDGFDNPVVNGSVVGNFDPPFAEETIVHSGNQSMPMAYDNAVGQSETTLTLTSNKDWTVNGVTTLTIWFRGASANDAETLYVALNGNARVNHDNPDAALRGSWTQWNISLQAFADQGVNLTNVDSITLGLSSVTGGTGIMYFDDIRLYAP